jgi:hypothetical protein
MLWKFLAEGVPEPFIKTVDYVSGQGPLWFLTAALIISGTVITVLFRQVLKDGREVKAELKVLSEKYINIVEKTATLLAENTADLRSFGRQVTTALEQSTGVVRGNTEAMQNNADAAKILSKANEASAEALIELKLSTDSTAAEARRVAETIASVMRRNTEALEESSERRKAAARKENPKT